MRESGASRQQPTRNAVAARGGQPRRRATAWPPGRGDARTPEATQDLNPLVTATDWLKCGRVSREPASYPWARRQPGEAVQRWIAGVDEFGGELEEVVDETRFDGLARLLGRATSRRGGIAAAAAALAGAAVPALAGARGADGPASEQCLRNGQRCGKGSGNNGGPCKTCCSRHWTTGKKRTRCTCKPDGMRCNNSSQCCNGTCNPGSKTCGAGGQVIPTGQACSPAAGDTCEDPNASCLPYEGRGNATFCVLARGEECTENEQCVTDTCGATPPGIAGGIAPQATGACCGGDGLACASAGDCCFGLVCNGMSATCTACVVQGEPCSTNSDCCAGLGCDGVSNTCLPL